MKYVIKHDNGTYFKMLSGIGPCFGAVLKDAQKFDTEADAAFMQTRHMFGFDLTKVVEIKEKDK